MHYSTGWATKHLSFVFDVYYLRRSRSTVQLVPDVGPLLLPPGVSTGAAKLFSKGTTWGMPPRKSFLLPARYGSYDRGIFFNSLLSTLFNSICKWKVFVTFSFGAMTLLLGSYHDPVYANAPSFLSFFVNLSSCIFPTSMINLAICDASDAIRR